MTLGGKIYSILTPSQRKSALGLMGLMVIGMVLETLGIGLVIPTVAILTQRPFPRPVCKVQEAWMIKPCEQTAVSNNGLGHHAPHRGLDRKG